MDFREEIRQDIVYMLLDMRHDALTPHKAIIDKVIDAVKAVDIGNPTSHGGLMPDEKEREQVEQVGDVGPDDEIVDSEEEDELDDDDDFSDLDGEDEDVD